MTQVDKRFCKLRKLFKETYYVLYSRVLRKLKYT